MYVMVQVRMDVALALQQRQPATNASEELLNAAGELGVVLKPVHPSAKDPHLMQYFMVEVQDLATAKQVISRLQDCKAVEAAYLKPPDEMP